MLRLSLSPDAWNMLEDTSQWRHLVSNENAALLLGYIKQEVTHDAHAQIVGGMQRLPEKLVEEFRCSECG